MELTYDNWLEFVYPASNVRRHSACNRLGMKHKSVPGSEQAVGRAA